MFISVLLSAYRLPILVRLDHFGVDEGIAYPLCVILVQMGLRLISALEIYEGIPTSRVFTSLGSVFTRQHSLNGAIDICFCNI